LLRKNLGHFATQMPGLFQGDRKIQSAIIPIIIGRAEAAIEASRVLGERGFFVPAIRYPTVARDSARLRVTISARHTIKQITSLCEQLKAFAK
jgi:7-keto-8-aminopelargonate synthetase-like enzyme